MGIREKGGDSRTKHYRKFESNRGREVLTGSDKAFSKVFFLRGCISDQTHQGLLKKIRKSSTNRESLIVSKIDNEVILN